MVFEPYQQSVIIADKTTIKSLALLKVDLYVVDRTIRVPLIVLKNLSFDIILGMNFLNQNNVIIDANEKLIQFKIPKLEEESLASLTSTVVLPPFTEKIVQVQFKGVLPNTQVNNQQSGQL